MIRVIGRPEPPVPRLIAALASRGHTMESASRGVGSPADSEPPIFILGPVDSDPGRGAAAMGPTPPGSRILVLSWLGAHPDARAQSLRRLWDLEESARSARLPVITLRLAPLVGPRSPLWLKLRSWPRLPREGRRLLNPVAESDVLEALDRLLRGAVPWEGWFEVAGPEIVSLEELAALARAAGPRVAGNVGSWEPPLEILAEQRLSEAGPWLERFRIEPAPLADLARRWAA